MKEYFTPLPVLLAAILPAGLTIVAISQPCHAQQQAVPVIVVEPLAPVGHSYRKAHQDKTVAVMLYGFNSNGTKSAQTEEAIPKNRKNSAPFSSTMLNASRMITCLRILPGCGLSLARRRLIPPS